MTDHAHMRAVYMAETRTRHANPSQREFVSDLVRWARARHHRHINQRRAIRTGQLELFA